MQFQVGFSCPLTDHLRGLIIARNWATRGGLLPREGGAGVVGESAGLSNPHRSGAEESGQHGACQRPSISDMQRGLLCAGLLPLGLSLN